MKKDILKIYLSNGNKIELNSNNIFFDKRITKDINKTTIVAELEASDIENEKNIINDVLKLEYNKIDSIFINTDIVESNITTEYKVLSSILTNYNFITNDKSSSKKFLTLILEYSDVRS